MNSVWAGMFNRRFLLDNQLIFKEGMIAQEDTLFNYELSLKTNTVWKTETPCYLYRFRKSSVMHSKSNDRMRAYYHAMRIMLEAYENHLNQKDYRSLAELEDKILHSKENIAYCLAAQTDNRYVCEQMRELKQKKIYPYSFRKSTFFGKNKLRGILDYLLPLEPCFWIEHWAYATFNRCRYRIHR